MSAQFKRVLKFNATGALAIAAALDIPHGHYELVSIFLHFDADPGVENLTVDLDAHAGAAYDTNIITQAMSGIVDFIYLPDAPLILEGGDQLEFAQANAAGRTYGLQVTLREV